MNETVQIMLDLLTRAPQILAGGVAAVQSWQNLVDQIKAMASEGRDPTAQERQQIKDEIHALEARIYAQKP